MLELYLDTADLAQITRFAACLPLRGVTTNPSILAAANTGLGELLPALTEKLGGGARFHVQVVADTANAMLDEAERLAALPYDLVVKVPATETGLTAIKLMKAANIQVLATAVYTAQQGFLAALCGADYLAPYVNRIDALGGDGIGVVADLQCLLDKQQLPCKLLPASFKNAQQALAVLKLGVAAITLPPDVAQQMLYHPAVDLAVERFAGDWRKAFGDLPADQS